MGYLHGRRENEKLKSKKKGRRRRRRRKGGNRRLFWSRDVLSPAVRSCVQAG